MPTLVERWWRKSYNDTQVSKQYKGDRQKIPHSKGWHMITKKKQLKGTQE